MGCEKRFRFLAHPFSAFATRPSREVGLYLSFFIFSSPAEASGAERRLNKRKKDRERWPRGLVNESLIGSKRWGNAPAARPSLKASFFWFAGCRPRLSPAVNQSWLWIHRSLGLADKRPAINPANPSFPSVFLLFFNWKRENERKRMNGRSGREAED